MDTKRDEGMQEIKAKALRLSGLAEYQEGAVVSRTLIDKKIGTITIFAFDEGQGLSEHTAPFDALVYVIDGQAEVVIDGQARIVRAAEMIIMPANRPHALNARERFKMLLVLIKK